MKRVLRYAINSMYLALTPLSAVFLLAQVTGRSPWPGAAGMLACSLAGYAISGFLKERRAWVCMLALALWAASALLLLPYGIWSALVAVAGGVCLILAARHNEQDEEMRIVDVRVTAMGLMLSAVTYLIAFVNQHDRVMPQIGYITYVYIVATVLLLNAKSVSLNAGGQAKRMMRSNQVLAWGFAAVLTLCVFFAPLQRAVGHGLRWLVASFFNLFSSKPSVQEPAAGDAGSGQMDLSALGGQDKVMPQWLETLGNAVLYVIATVALLVLAAFILWSLYRTCRAAMRFLKDWLARFQPAAGQEYAEESEQLLSAQSMGKQLRDDLVRRFRQRFTPPARWSALTPQQRVRTIYRRLLMQQKRIESDAEGLTPGELCERAGRDAQFAALYDRARYSDGEITPQEAERYRDYLKS